MAGAERSAEREVLAELLPWALRELQLLASAEALPEAELKAEEDSAGLLLALLLL